MENQIILQGTTDEKLVNKFIEKIDKRFLDLEKKLQSKEAQDELLTRKEACQYLSIDQSTLFHWTNKGKVIAYGIANRRYYKRSELLESLIKLKK